MTEGLLNKSTDTRPLFYKDKCDKFDYLVSIGCGAVAGLIDIFFVGAPGKSVLDNWSDSQIDKVVMKFAKANGWKPRQGKEKSVASAIGYLEKKFPVNYDHRHTQDVDGLFKMSTKNHHIKSLAHAPDIVGLFFSILNQFTSTATFVSEGKLITIKTDTFELQGNNFISKIYCGFFNWLGHIISDIAGSSGSRGNGGRGSGVSIPFYELLQFCNFGDFKIGKHKQDLATLAVRAFQDGYDFRHGITMAIPVVLCNLLIKLIWSIKHFFYHKKPLKECIPTYRHDDLRVMLLFGNGTLCVMDGADALIRSRGDALGFFMRLNIIAWFKFVRLVLREICIRTGIAFPLQKQLDAYIRINEELEAYLNQLEQTDKDRFNKETAQYKEFTLLLESTETETDINTLLKITYKELKMEHPYQGDFDTFMSDKDNKMVFK